MESNNKPIHNWTWQGRIDDTKDAQAARIHQVIKQIDLADLSNHPSGITLLGYACDEGVKRNKGRVGAVDGPNEIRRALSGMANHSDLPLYDIGNCPCPDTKMEETQSMFSQSVTALLSAGNKVIGLGGGHDIAYAHGVGVYDYLQSNHPNSKLGIINLDAHFDLRAPVESSNSGTPFYQLAQEHPDNFNYLAIGIQKYGNTQRLFTTAEEVGATCILRDDLQFQFDQAIERLKAFINSIDHIYLTIDLDGIDAAICPGVSAPSTNGMNLKEIHSIIDAILESGKLISMDIAELNPWYDKDCRTAKVAAYLIHSIIGKLD